MSIAAFRGQPLVDNQRGLDIQEAQLKINQQTQQSTKVNKILTDTSKTIQGIVESARDRGMDPRGPEVQAAIKDLVSVGTKTAQQYQSQTGIDHVSGFTGSVQAALNTPSLEELRKQEALDKAAQDKAAAESALALTPETDKLAEEEARRAQENKERFGGVQQLDMWKSNGSGRKVGYLGPDGLWYHDKEMTKPAPDYVKASAVQTTTDAQQGGVTGNLVEPTKTSHNSIQKGMMAADAAIQTMNAVREDWRPEFNTFKTQLGVWFTNLLEKGGADLTPEQKGIVEDFSTWKANSFRLLNDRIQFLSGAATSVQEAERIQKEMPNINDAPTEYLAKLNNTMKEMRKARERLHYYSLRGIPPVYHDPSFKNIKEAEENNAVYPFPVFGEDGGVTVEDFQRTKKPAYLKLLKEQDPDGYIKNGQALLLELKSEGLSREEINKRMAKEGYN